MARVCADHAHHAFATNDATVLADAANGTTYFHCLTLLFMVEQRISISKMTRYHKGENYKFANARSWPCFPPEISLFIMPCTVISVSAHVRCEWLNSSRELMARRKCDILAAMKNTLLILLRRFVLALGTSAAFCAHAVPATNAQSDDLQANPVPAIGQNAEDQKAFDPAKKGPRVLFVGNSITLHGPRPQIGWSNNWGMAASARDKDYVHLLQKKIAAVRPDAQCCLLQVANTFERAFFKKDWSCERNFKWAREFKPDVIVFFFGANVPKTYNAGTMSPAPARTFGEALDAFRTYLDPEGQALVLISQGFYIRPKLDAEKKAVAKKHGDVFVNMEDIRARKDTHGRFNHPGDLGMELIAERFWQHIEKRIRDVRR